MDSRTFETPYGPIVLWGEDEVWASGRPLIVAIAGAYAAERGAFFHLAPHLSADVVIGHLPGNHCPPLVQQSVDTFAAAYSYVISTAFRERTVVVCGASIGGLVALGLKAPQIRRLVVAEPPLVMSKVWPLWPTLRATLAAAADDPQAQAFVTNVFGVTETAISERRYDRLLEQLGTPTDVPVGDRALYPERAFEKMPSLVDEPERALLSAHPLIRVSVLAGAGHNVLQEAAPAYVAIVRRALADAAG
jgi:pimeloyl-ACP methyl ester carboxylesterase